MLLGNLLKSIDKDHKKINIKGISFDSRKVKKNYVFFGTRKQEIFIYLFHCFIQRLPISVAFTYVRSLSRAHYLHPTTRLASDYKTSMRLEDLHEITRLT